MSGKLDIPKPLKLVQSLTTICVGANYVNDINLNVHQTKHQQLKLHYLVHQPTQTQP